MSFSVPQLPHGVAPSLVRPRAAVLGVSNNTGSNVEGEYQPVAAKQKANIHLTLVMLPAGVPAGALGRNVLIPNTKAWAEARLGPPGAMEVQVPWWCWEVLFWSTKDRCDELRVAGPVDIPMLFDHVGNAVGVDEDLLVLEMQPLEDLGRQIFKTESSLLAPVRTAFRAPRMISRALRSAGKEWRSVVSDIRDIGGSPSPRPPGERPDLSPEAGIGGVGYRSWVEVAAGLPRDNVHPAHVAMYAAYRGVPMGDWTSIDRAWSQRATADPELQAWAAFDRYRLRSTGAHWDDGA